MVLRNFPGLRGEELLDRLVELSLYIPKSTSGSGQ
jgi:hypothetical protein